MGGNWLQDVAVNTVHFMLKSGMTREMFYCPSNANHQKDNDLFWTYANKTWNPHLNRFENDSNFIVSGYCFIWQTTQVDRPEIVRYQNDDTRKIWVKTTQEKQSGSRELCIDSIMGVPQSNTKYGRNFSQVPGGIWAESQVYDQTSHLKSDEPAGGNIGFLDGHVEWRAFEPEIENSVAVPRFGNTPGFFW
jgi:prepilin-type processing-associated H-X9-DG protein